MRPLAAYDIDDDGFSESSEDLILDDFNDDSVVGPELKKQIQDVGIYTNVLYIDEVYNKVQNIITFYSVFLLFHSFVVKIVH